MKKIKTLSVLAISCILGAYLTQTPAAAANEQEEISLFLNGSYLNCEVAPLIMQGEILVPLRNIGEAMDVGIYWNEQTKTASLKSSGWRGAVEAEFTCGSNIAQINGNKETLPAPVQIINGRTMVPLQTIAENLDMASYWDEKTQTLSLQEQYCFENGENEVILTPLKPDTDSKNMIYHGMQVEINDVKYEYAWDWNASVWQYIVYAPPEVYWADLNEDGEEEIIIRLLDGINRGTGVAFEDIHILKQNGEEIAVQDAGEYALSLAKEQDGISVGDWVSYELIDGELTAAVTVLANDEQKIWQMKYGFVNGKMQVVEVVSEKY